jgi:hypothetical protein
LFVGHIALLKTRVSDGLLQSHVGIRSGITHESQVFTVYQTCQINVD